MSTLENYTNLINSTDNVSQLQDIKDYASTMLFNLGSVYSKPCREFEALFTLSEIAAYRSIYRSVEYKAQYKLERVL